ncbi:uncharacterized protein LOC130992439 isoform X2 [Salvia miltiorrhiza]|uniref:uncharacterized protein LOC130992439 isoform X2 n=1 Tax=Salvia miltiorrhiza TaxID=226208 RepID=UPI0025AD0E4E|nr:uncharacterized protein LOC130992439 isoform X2 [Salvia miltiorrhiza]
MSSRGMKTVGVRDLVEEAKKRTVFLIVSVVGLSYLMSLTSSSVLVNLPAALLLIIILRYLSLDMDIRRKTATYKSKQTSANISSKKNPLKGLRIETERSDWKHNVNSPVVEDAIDQFSRHIVSEWVTDLWYSRITPDRQGPEELVVIMNGVIGVISNRMRNVNLIDLLTRDIIRIVCRRLELFRATKIKIERHQSRFLTVEERDIELKSLLAAENKLHPILFSAEAEHKVLQHVMDGLIVLTFKPEDLRCSLFRYIIRELLACVVIRPVLNLANPRFINERIESFVISRKVEKGSVATNAVSESRTNAPPRIPSDHVTQIADPSVKGVELVQLKKDEKYKEVNTHESDAMTREILSKDPLLSMDARSTRSWNSFFPDTHNGEEKGLQRELSGGEWGNALDVFSRRKTKVLAPEHFENMWTKGRDYRRKEDTDTLADHAQRNSVVGVSNSAMQTNGLPEQKKKEKSTAVNTMGKDLLDSRFNRKPEEDNAESLREEEDHESVPSDEVESWSSSYTEDDDMNNVMGLDSPGVKVWDGKNKRNFSHIHHPLETFDRHKSTKTKNSQLRSTLQRTKSAKKRSRSSTNNGQIWQEIERTSFLLEGQDLLNLNHSKVTGKPGDSSEDSEAELLGRINSGATTSSSMSYASLPESRSLAANSAKTSVIADSYFTLRCEVLGANIVKSGSKTFAVYCISVTDMNSHSWSIKRRYQHFVELHRRLKEFPEYNLHLPPKHFLSTGLDVFVIQERCKLLDQYLKKLLQFPTISCSIEVWDFLSVDSQMYIFSDSLSIIDTLSVDLDETVHPKIKDYRDNIGPAYDQLSSKNEILSHGNQDSASRIKGDQATDGLGMKGKGQVPSSSKRPEKEFKKGFDHSNNDSENSEQKSVKRSSNLERTVDRDHQTSHSLSAEDSSDPMLPSEWVPPNLNVPVFDLVDVILQLKDGGWIRRKAFWVAKQVLQLGMGDAFDDWLIEKIQRFRRGSVVASGIRRLEQILWPDGIFITKHPRRQRPPPHTPSPGDQSPAPYSSPKTEDPPTLEEIQKQEAERRAKFVYELMIVMSLDICYRQGSSSYCRPCWT